MSNLFRWGILPAFLMTFSGMSQDIAAPSMANVDLEMEDEKKIAAYREAMARHLQLGIIWTCIVELEEKDNRAVLVDDVLYTGRTIRAALNALFDYGRPARIELACLIDRGGREVPIQPDYTGHVLDHAGAKVIVSMKEADGEDSVVIPSH